VKNEIFDKIISDFHADFFYPKIGIELEFYLTKNNQQIADPNLIENFIAELSVEAQKQKIDLWKIEKEQGLGQIEIKTNPNINLDRLSFDIELIKVISEDLARKNNLKADFSPTPFFDDCSNALQINLTLLDKNHQNLFVKNGEEESQILLNSIAGILENIPQNLESFITSKTDISRFDLARNKKLFNNKKYTSPVNLSWGYDNRSCAIRIVGNGENRRLELRIADANISVRNAISKSLEMIKHGIAANLQPSKPIYGNAFDEQYQDLIEITKICNF